MHIDLNALAKKIATDLDRPDYAEEQGKRGASPTPAAGGESLPAVENVEVPPRATPATPAAVSAVVSAEPVVPPPPPAPAAPPSIPDVVESVAALPALPWAVPTNARIADVIEHTLLAPEATRRDIERLCDEALEHRFATVCVNPLWVPVCAMRTRGTGVGIVSVVGFPLGASQPEIKAAEAALAVRQGATEIDVVAAIGKIRSGEWGEVADEIAAVVRAADGAPVKVILESALLSPVEIIRATAVARDAGARFVKTSSGFVGGATVEAVALMRLVAGEAMGVKASGGIRDCASALRMLANGATRIGTSSGVALVQCLGAEREPLAVLAESPARHTLRCTCV